MKVAGDTEWLLSLRETLHFSSVDLVFYHSVIRSNEAFTMQISFCVSVIPVCLFVEGDTDGESLQTLCLDTETSADWNVQRKDQYEYLVAECFGTRIKASGNWHLLTGSEYRQNQNIHFFVESINEGCKRLPFLASPSSFVFQVFMVERKTATSE